jgi:hypothetical protein
MDFIVTMRPHPGDKVVSTAEIRMYDASGMQVEGQFLLEAETAETRLSMPPGGRMEITEHERRNVVDANQTSAVPIGTAEREINWDSPNTPAPKTEREMRKVEEEYAKRYQKEQDDKKRQREADEKKSGEARTAVESKHGGHTADMSRSIDTSKDDKRRG